MLSIVPQVHLVLCMDPKTPVGPLLQALDLLRARDWQKEIILVCDAAWSKNIDPNDSVWFMERNKLLNQDLSSRNNQALDEFLEQLDDMEIVEVTEVGDLGWARWLHSYLETLDQLQYRVLMPDGVTTIPTDFMNQLSRSWGLDQKACLVNSSHPDIIIDPYLDGSISPLFIGLLKTLENRVPEWITILCKQSDWSHLDKMIGEGSLMDYEDISVCTLKHSLLVFDSLSPLFQCSRSYNVALLNSENTRHLFVPGDIQIHCKEPMYWSELLTLLNYWRISRLPELAFQWSKVDRNIVICELSHQRLVERNLLEYSNDLHCVQVLVDHFLVQNENSAMSITPLLEIILRQMQYDSVSFSCSLKMLMNITERMIQALMSDQAMASRLGSDMHRILIAETVIDKLGAGIERGFQQLNIVRQLKSFLKFMIQIDFINDEWLARSEYRSAG